MHSKNFFKNLYLLILPLVFWGVATWFRFERISQLISYPLCYLFLLNIYYSKLKGNKFSFILGSISIIIILSLALVSNLDNNLLFYIKVIWINVLGFQFINFRTNFNNQEFLFIKKFSRFIRLFLTSSIILFFIQILIDASAMGKAGGFIKFTGGWFDGNYYGGFCLLLFIALSELSLKFKKKYPDGIIFYPNVHIRNTLIYSSIIIFSSLSLTSIALLVFYNLRLINKRFYIFLLSIIITSSLLFFTVFNNRTLTYVTNLADRQGGSTKINNYNRLQLYYRYRLFSLRGRLIKSKDISNDLNEKSDIATHNSFVTILKNIKINKYVDNHIYFLALLIYLFLSLIIIKLTGSIVAINYILLSIVLDTFFSGFSLSIPFFWIIQSVYKSSKE